MAKELPYFQFEPAEYLTKDISFCSLPAQGLFINICSYYWQRECNLTKDQLLKRLNHEKELNELITEKVISVIDNDISVKFLDEQYKNATSKSNTNRINGLKGGRPKKINPTESESKPKINLTESESKGIREEKRRENKNKEDKIIEEALEKPTKFSFKKSLIELGTLEPSLSDWLEVRKKKKANNSETALKGLIREAEKANISINEAVIICAERSWQSFKSDWVKEQKSDNRKPRDRFDTSLPPANHDDIPEQMH